MWKSNSNWNLNNSPRQPGTPPPAGYNMAASYLSNNRNFPGGNNLSASYTSSSPRPNTSGYTGNTSQSVHSGRPQQPGQLGGYNLNQQGPYQANFANNQPQGLQQGNFANNQPQGPLYGYQQPGYDNAQQGQLGDPRLQNQFMQQLLTSNWQNFQGQPENLQLPGQRYPNQGPNQGPMSQSQRPAQQFYHNLSGAGFMNFGGAQGYNTYVPGSAPQGPQGPQGPNGMNYLPPEQMQQLNALQQGLFQQMQMQMMQQSQAMNASFAQGFQPQPLGDLVFTQRWDNQTGQPVYFDPVGKKEHIADMIEWFDPIQNVNIPPPPTIERWRFQRFGKSENWGVGDEELIKQEQEVYVKLQNDNLQELIRRVKEYRDYEDFELRDLFRRTNDKLNQEPYPKIFEDIAKLLKRKEIDLDQIFDRKDPQSQGVISKQDFAKIMAKQVQVLSSLVCTFEDLEKICECFGLGSKGYIFYQQFLNKLENQRFQLGGIRLTEQRNFSDRNDLYKSIARDFASSGIEPRPFFEKFDETRTGTIDSSQFKKLVGTICQTVKTEDIELIVDDVKFGKQVDYSEFSRNLNNFYNEFWVHFEVMYQIAEWAGRSKIDLIAALRHFDAQDTKKIHRADLERTLYDAGFYTDGSKLDAFLSSMELNHTPFVDLNYFLSYMPIIAPSMFSSVKQIKARILDHLNSIQESAGEFFRKFDQVRDGKLTPFEIQKALKEIGVEFSSSQELMNFVQHFDRTNKGTVDIYFLNREFKVNLRKPANEPSSPDRKFPAPNPRDDEFKKTPRRNPNLNRPGTGYGYDDYNPSQYPHGLSPGLVGSPSKYVYDPNENEFSMWSSMQFDPLIKRTGFSPTRAPKLVHYSGYKEEYNQKRTVVPKFDHSLLSRGKGDWADNILQQIKLFANKKRMSVVDFINEQDKYGTGYITYQDFFRFLQMVGGARADFQIIQRLSEELDTVMDNFVDLEELGRRISGHSKVSVLTRLHNLPNHWAFPILWNIKLWCSANEIDLNQLFSEYDFGGKGWLSNQEFVSCINERLHVDSTLHALERLGRILDTGEEGHIAYRQVAEYINSCVVPLNFEGNIHWAEKYFNRLKDTLDRRGETLLECLDLLVDENRTASIDDFIRKLWNQPELQFEGSDLQNLAQELDKQQIGRVDIVKFEKLLNHEYTKRRRAENAISDIKTLSITKNINMKAAFEFFDEGKNGIMDIPTFKRVVSQTMAEILLADVDIVADFVAHEGKIDTYEFLSKMDDVHVIFLNQRVKKFCTQRKIVLRDILKQYDAYKDGYITIPQIKNGLDSLEMDLNPSEVFEIINGNHLPMLEDGRRSYEHLLDKIYTKVENKNKETAEALYKRIRHHWQSLNVNAEEIFKSFDPKHDGHINIHNFGLALIQSRLNLYPEEIDALQEDVAKQSDGRLSYQHFLYKVNNASS